MRPERLVCQSSLDRIGVAFEIGVFEAVAAREPDHLPALDALVLAYTRAGRNRDALRIDRRLCALLPANPLAHYNLACSLALLGALDDALRALERALALGYRDKDQLKKDPDLAALRKDPRWRALIARAA